MPKIRYATRLVNSNQCMIRRDYSYLINSNYCLKCAYCYCKVKSCGITVLSKGGYLNEEEKHNSLLYKTPMVISRFFEPFLAAKAALQAFIASRHTIDKGGQLIYRTFYPLDIQENILKFYKENKDNIQFQMKYVFDDESFLTQNFKKKILPHRKISYAKTTEKAKILLDNGLNVIALFDPVIVGLNLTDISAMLDRLIDLGIKKVIFKQLFATDYFKTVLGSLVSSTYVKILSEGQNELKTYKNEVLLFYMQSIIEKCYKNDIDFSFCLNLELNKLFNVFDKYSNCCMFDNPTSIYNVNVSPFLRKYPLAQYVDLSNGYNKEIQKTIYG